MVAEKLAQVTRETAERTGATVVDMAVLSANHDACSAEPWVNGFRPKTGTSFHPTMAGARATAQAVANAITLWLISRACALGKAPISP
ncbi:hypothetical protein [Edaphobacter aggregans]|uniref:hypothetical protein n=1 Tax=Edaphobacter aggregans TaxID=570835 RepID=UPI000F73E954|nr:hypothetical protein [Edaphobacter aggregans]